MRERNRSYLVLIVLLLAALACQSIELTGTPSAQATPTRDLATPTPTIALEAIDPVLRDPNEPAIITGEVEYTSPFFLNSAALPFVMLEDQAGFYARDNEFVFSLPSQVIGPVDLVDDDTLTYTLVLPAIPAGTFLNFDTNDPTKQGVQVFAVAYWSNTWGGPFLEERDGTGWSTGYASTITDPEREYEITGGKLVIWAPDDQQFFPTGFGADNLLFTTDDPIGPVLAGYTVVDLDANPFTFTREAQPVIELYEGAGAVNDFSDMEYAEAFDALFEKASREYPFTAEKDVDWDALYEEYAPDIHAARNDLQFYAAVKRFLLAIPDGHIGISIDGQAFYDEYGGSFGMVLTELTDKRVLVTQVIPGTPADTEGIQPGDEILTWNGQPVSQAIDAAEPYFGPYSTSINTRLDQVLFLTRMPVGTDIEIEIKPVNGNPRTIEMTSEVEYDSLFASIPDFSRDELALPVEAQIFEDAGLGYIRINTFSDDYYLMANLWQRAMDLMIDSEIPGLILDVRVNGGGSSGMARDFTGFFFEESFDLYRRSYFNEVSGTLEYLDDNFNIEPAPEYYPGQVAVLIGPDCVSACEGFAYSLAQSPNVVLIGHLPTAGAYGEVGQGQYDLPGGYSVQFPTGRSETLDGMVLIEGTGVIPDIRVPITADSALGIIDTVLERAIDTLLDRIQ